MNEQTADHADGGSISKRQPHNGLRFLYILAGLVFIYYAICLIEAVRVLRIWQVVVLLAVCASTGISLLAIGVVAKRDRFIVRR